MGKSPRRVQTSKQSHKRQVDIKLPQAAEDHPRQLPATCLTDQKGAAAPQPHPGVAAHQRPTGPKEPWRLLRTFIFINSVYRRLLEVGITWFILFCYKNR